MGALLLAPFIVGVPLLLLLVVPRLDDLNYVLRSKLGKVVRISNKHWLIDKFMTKKLIQKVFTQILPILIGSVFLLGLMSYIIGSQWLFLSLPLFVALLSIWLSYLVWSNFQKACDCHHIGEYAANSYIKNSILEWTSITIVMWGCVFLMILFASSNLWISSIESFVFGPVTLLEPYQELIPVGELQYTGLVGAFAILSAFSFIGLLFFVVFPYLDKMGRKGTLGVLAVFSLTYFTEVLASWILQGTINIIVQPFGLISPIIAALIAQIAQNKYKKLIKKRLARAKDSDQYAPPTM